jgi:Fur family peroxide stress response transcriptional regulator
MEHRKSQDLLNEKGRRMTKQRRAILKALRDTQSHPDAYWIYDNVRQQIPNISLGTIYRSLKVLCEMGFVQELTYGDQHSRYDGNVSNHGHATCILCGRIADVNMPLNGDASRYAECETGFEITALRVEFQGICPACSVKFDKQAT